MITKNYTADRTETPGDATSTIPAAMANYWINGVNSLISDLTPLKDAGGFYAPVDFNTFKCTTTTTATTGLKIPLTKIIGGLSISSDEITLPKGYLYSVFVDFDFTPAGGTGEATMDITDLSNNSKLQRYCNKASVYLVSAGASSTGNGIIDLTSAASDLVVKAYVRSAGNNPYISAALGGVYITKYKLIPFTATT